MAFLPPDPATDGFSGWPRLLPGLLVGQHDDAGALAEVAEAVRLERRVVTRTVELRVDAVRALEVLDPSEVGSGLWCLDVVLSTDARKLRGWEGALLRRDLADSGTPWSAEIVETDLRRGRLFVAGDPTSPPQVGMVRALPFDFLRAAQLLVESPRLVGARPALARLLGAARGALAARGPLPASAGTRGPATHAHAAWTWPWAMVWGPPGTGKTHTLVEEVTRILQDPDQRVLVVSTTNKAVDEVALRLGRQPGGVLRVGSARVGPYRQAGLLELLPRPRVRLDHIQAAEERLASARSDRARAQARLALSRARRGLPRLKDLLSDMAPRCVLATSHAAMAAVVSDAMEPFLRHERAPFTTVVVDEAGLVTRSTAAGLGLLAARQVVLVGDPKQLSPICVAARSMAPPVKRWLALSAMEHADLGQPATQPLMRQHRMHPDISAVVSLFQYGGRLDDAYEIRDRVLPDGLAGRLVGWPRAAWVVLEKCDGHDLTSVAPERGAQRSWERRAGVEVFGWLLARYPELGRLRGLFMSPYRAQAHRVQTLLEERGLAERWEASTVHAQQGSEADVVVFDLVRHGGWAMPEWKRLVNVALSRARHQLLVLASGPELDGQAGCGGLVGGLVRCSVTAEGVLRREAAPDAQGSIFGLLSTSIDAHPPTAASPRVGASSRVAQGAPRSHPAPPTPDPADLGTQIFHSRAARRSMTRAQAQLVRREIKDLGPRVVRGVAGSGKTIVLVRWAAVELKRHPDRKATIVFGNTALRRHLARLIEQAWRVTVDDRCSEPPWDRIELVHIGALLRDLLGEAGLPLPARNSPAEYDYESQARALLGTVLRPRFGLLYLDEAQDLGHDTLGLLISLVQSAPNPAVPGQPHLPVRVFYDNAQNVYRRSTPRWSEFGLDMRGRSVVLRESFRSTRPGMEFALGVVHALRPLDEDPDFRELIAPRQGEALLVPRPGGRWRADFCVVAGQAPLVALHDTAEDELAALVARVRGWLSEGVSARDIRVLSPRRQRCEQLAAALCRAGIDALCARNTSFDNADPRVVVTTPQSFKGYEAELIAVVGVEGFVARRRERAEVLVEALYVALTRARTWMWVSGVRVPEADIGARVIAAVEGAVEAESGPV